MCPSCAATFASVTEFREHEDKCRILYGNRNTSTAAPDRDQHQLEELSSWGGKGACVKCNLVCADDAELRRHRRHQHPDTDASAGKLRPTGSIGCTQCTAEFASTGARDAHTAAVHPVVSLCEITTRTVCAVCAATFASVTERKEHEDKCLILLGIGNTSTAAPDRDQHQLEGSSSWGGKRACVKCNLVCADDAELRRHRCDQHLDTDASAGKLRPTGSIRCTECTAAFVSTGARNVHTAAIHAAVPLCER